MAQGWATISDLEAGLGTPEAINSSHEALSERTGSPARLAAFQVVWVGFFFLLLTICTSGFLSVGGGKGGGWGCEQNQKFICGVSSSLVLPYVDLGASRAFRTSQASGDL